MSNDIVTLTSAQRTVTVYASSARVATPNGQEFILESNLVEALTFVIDMTAVTATGQVTFDINAVDPVSGKAYAIKTGVVVTATGTTVVKVHPNMTPVTGAVGGAAMVVQDMVPPRFRVTATHLNGVSVTYSVSASVNT